VRAARRRGPWMQDVEVEDDTPVADPGVGLPATLRAAVRWGGRHAVGAAVLAVVLLTVGSATVLGVPRWSLAAERRALTLPVSAPGLVQPQPEAPGSRWSARVPWDARVVLAGETVVAWSARADDPVVTGVDLVTGAVRWRTRLPDDGRGTVRTCLPLVLPGIGAAVACLGVVGGDGLGEQGLPLPVLTTDVVLDADDGSVVARRSLVGAVGSVVATGTDVILVVAHRGRLDAARVDVRSGVERWRVPVLARPSPTDVERLVVVLRGGVALVAGAGSATALDAGSGRRVVADLAATGRLDTAGLLIDGSVVASAYGAPSRALSLTSTVYGPDGSVRLTLPGAVREPALSDGAAGQLYCWSEPTGGPFVGRVSAVDRRTGQVRWRSQAAAADVLVDVGGVAVFLGGGYVVGVDARTGVELWRRVVSINTSTDVLTDGSRLLVVRLEPWRGAVVRALDLRDGTTVWEVDLPTGVTRVEQLGTHLVGVGPGLVVLLR